MTAMSARPRSTHFALVAPCLGWSRMRIVGSCRGKPAKIWRQASQLMLAVIGKSSFMASRNNNRLQLLSSMPSSVSSVKNSPYCSTLDLAVHVTLLGSAR
jgi:hypothetical protein